jgi:hypothetical protein
VNVLQAAGWENWVMRRCLALSVAVFALGLACVRTTPVAPNQQQPLTSPGGSFVLTLPIEENRVNPQYEGTRVWKVTITDPHGNVVYKDDESEFVGYLNVYWMWDSDDRVWVYSSDTGDVFFWELVDDEWTKTWWGAAQREIDRPLEPPPGLYPPYAH